MEADGSGRASSDLELLDAVIGLQAQLDELTHRFDRLEAQLRTRDDAAPRSRVRLVARARAAVGRARTT